MDTDTRAALIPQKNQVALTIGVVENPSADLGVVFPLAVISVSWKARCMCTESAPALSHKGTYHVAHTIGTIPDTTAILGVLYPLAVILVSWKAECVYIESAPALSHNGTYHVAHTIGIIPDTTAILGVLIPLAVILVSCRAKCMHSGSGPALSLRETMWHIPFGKVRTPLPLCLSSLKSPSYLRPVEQSAWSMRQGLLLGQQDSHDTHTISPGMNASAVPGIVLPIAVVLFFCRAESINTVAGGSALSPKQTMWHKPLAKVKTPVPFRLPSFHRPTYLFPVRQSV